MARFRLKSYARLHEERRRSRVPKGRCPSDERSPAPQDGRHSDDPRFSADKVTPPAPNPDTLAYD